MELNKIQYLFRPNICFGESKIVNRKTEKKKKFNKTLRKHLIKEWKKRNKICNVVSIHVSVPMRLLKISKA